MGLGGRLDKAMLKRIESSPGVQERIARSERTMPVIRAAHKAAFSPLDDETVKAKLREDLDAEPEIVEEAASHFHRLDDYIGDRSYRLLSAAAAGTAVTPISPERAELFVQEGWVGRAPMEQAFQRLAEIESVKKQEERAKHSDPRNCGLPKHIKEPLHQLVGGGASSNHELASVSALSILGLFLPSLMIG
jgi:hypothetical protein